MPIGVHRVRLLCWAWRKKQKPGRGRRLHAPPCPTPGSGARPRLRFAARHPPGEPRKLKRNDACEARRASHIREHQRPRRSRDGDAEYPGQEPVAVLSHRLVPPPLLRFLKASAPRISRRALGRPATPPRCGTRRWSFCTSEFVDTATPWLLPTREQRTRVLGVLVQRCRGTPGVGARHGGSRCGGLFPSEPACQA